MAKRVGMEVSIAVAEAAGLADVYTVRERYPSGERCGSKIDGTCTEIKRSGERSGSSTITVFGSKSAGIRDSGRPR